VERDSLLGAIRRGSGRGSLDSQVLAARDRLRERADALTARLSDSAFQVAIWPDGAQAQMLLRNAARSGVAYDTVGARLLADSLVAALKLSGIWPQPAEGDTYFSLYERWFFDVASPLLTDAGREYLSLDIEEQERRTGEDGSILIGWSTLGNRLARADRLLAANPEAPFASDLARSREQYLVLFLAGTGNTPIFTWREKQLRPEVLRSLEDFVKVNADLPAAADVKAFLDLLRKNGYKDTPAVRTYMRKLWAR
jgi:hypothetical protein